MIQSDLCDQWYHYECVGTTADEAAMRRRVWSIHHHIMLNGFDWVINKCDVKKNACSLVINN